MLIAHNQQCTHSHCLHSAAPDQVSGVRFVPSTNENSLSVEWSRPRSDVPILYYEVRYRSHTGSRSWQGPVRATAESVTLRIIMVPSASYGVQVRAVSAIGKGPYSREETVKRLLQHIHMCTHMYTHIHTHKHIYTDTQHAHVHTHTHTHTSTHTLTRNMHIYTHMHTDIQHA